jgi:SAM-dependent methyltransferase
MTQDERALRGSSFGGVAASYAEHRPDYAEAAVRWAIASAPGLRILDLGAGTGKVTGTLVDLGAEVTAVEPDPAMLTELRSRLPGVRALSGTAEAIPLPDASVDAVVAGQAMHWFNMSVAGPEIARVLVPGGILAGLWNIDDDRVDWVAGLERISEGSASLTLSTWESQVADSRLATMFLDDLFGPPERAEFPHGWYRTADSLLATIATHSKLLIMDDEARSALLGRIRDYLAHRPETSAGEFLLPMVTGVLRAQRIAP